MKAITMVDLRTKGRGVIKRLERGEKIALTYRGRRVAVLVPEPPVDRPAPADSMVRRLTELADPTLEPMTNGEIDAVLYGSDTDLP